MRDVEIRPMVADDVPVAEQLSDEAFFELDQRTTPRDWPAPQRRTPEHSATWISRTRRFLEHDPGGCWVAEDGSGTVGFATSFVRERVWCLATYAVRPGLQGAGIGRRLLEAAEGYGAACSAGLLSASVDPRAVRRYWRSGFDLHPQMLLRGTVDRQRLETVAGVREGRPDDVPLMDRVARDIRGGGHGPDHAGLAELARPLVAETATGRGFAYTDGTRLAVLAATDEATARALLWTCLADAGPEYLVPHVTAANQWAIDVALTAGLELAQSGYLGVRGMAPPAPYVHNGALL
ncbi:GNAT family N-acetyltransferase [Nocardioides bizhenqiangii]|uniref:GNAT family N-acetyltransferase n=1 Tax=Nocardioides bizhenqiangii TaxID=3095076 RepID=A0ABZ0ZMV9_9ACTN|nr:GNAT family N-acetyltransferase [Nocardioides sp. HM61]WQQ25096.1 GNAT family N-acetyltransferase [Nocardioides sp. HM61]